MVGIATTPFWRDDAPRPADLEVAESPPPEADVVVVGAGYTGLNAARELLAAGRSVVVVDAGAVGAGASSVNGGMVNYGLKASTAKVYDTYGPALGREFWDASLASLDLVEKVVHDEGIDCDYFRGGAGELGYRDRDVEAFTRKATWLHETVGFEMEVIGPDRVRQVADSAAFRGAIVDRVGAGLQPAKYVLGLGRAVARRGGAIVENARVTEVRSHGGGHEVVTAKGPVRAGAVLLATNGYTEGRPLPELRRLVVPLGSYIVVTEPLPHAQAERLIPGGRMLWTARRFLNYFRRTADDRILMGGRQNLSTSLDLVESAGFLRAATAAIFPELADVTYTHSWSGKLGITFDLMPHIGRIDGVWYALGYGGHGVGISTLVGAEVGRMIAGTQTRSPFAEITHPTRFYYRERTWFLPFAAVWYRFLDRIGR
jgi:glycine/D-amino acid oxidase-like deaminating enzyme